MIFHSHANQAHFQKKGCALGLILKVRVFGTRKWPIPHTRNYKGNEHNFRRNDFWDRFSGQVPCLYIQDFHTIKQRLPLVDSWPRDLN